MGAGREPDRKDNQSCGRSCERVAKQWQASWHFEGELSGSVYIHPSGTGHPPIELALADKTMDPAASVSNRRGGHWNLRARLALHDYSPNLRFYVHLYTAGSLYVLHSARIDRAAAVLLSSEFAHARVSHPLPIIQHRCACVC